MPTILYSETPAAGRFAGVVESVWSVIVDPAGPGDPSHCVLPDGCATLSFRLSDDSRIAIRPPSLHPFRAPATAGEHSIGVRFRPGALERLPEAWIARVTSMRFGSVKAPAAIAILEEQLDSLIPLARDPDSRVEALVNFMRRSEGAIAVREAAERIDLSERQLERLCSRNLRLTPKEFARTVRLQAVVRWLIARSDVNVAQAAAQFGYADQAHMGREFVALGGLNPTTYVRALKDLRFSLHSGPIPMSDLF